jgi:hypothetical protein
MKAEVYVSLSTINESLELVTEHLEKLKVAGVLFPELTEIRRTALEQLRSEINASAANVLYTHECETAHQLEQQRLTLESSLNAEEGGQSEPN